ncbi:MAG: MMPL family transporter [Clostridiales bacterium]|nr:MMPL family transporter [Clostridiales bacterium]MDY4172104.1 MMPL family transporter [Evtepia sp.]
MRMLDKIAKLVTRKPKLVLLIALLMMIPAIIGNAATRINYDILAYIPQDLDSAKGEALLEDPFRMAATGMLIVEDMPADYAAQLQQAIEEVDGVSQVLSMAGSVGSQLPPSMLPEDLQSMFYGNGSNPNSTMMMIFFDAPAADKITADAIAEIDEITNEKCFLAGFSALITDMQNLLAEEMPLYVAAAVVLAVVAMSIMMESWLLPVAIILNIGLAIIYNMGSNVFLGEISFVTSSLVAILQLGVTMDYSVFLYDRYREELPNYADPRDAMAQAVKQAFLSLSASSLTTVAGFAALCVMRLTLGRDVGVVMMKGVILGVLCVVLVLPSILLVLDRPIQKYTHKALNPDFEPMNRFLVKRRWVFLAVALVAAPPAIYSQTHTDVYHDIMGNMVPETASSQVATDKLEEDYDMVNQHFLLIHQDALTGGDTVQLVDALKELEGIDSVLTFRSYVANSVPDFFIPDDVMEMFQQEGWTYIMLNSTYQAGTDEMTGQINQINELAKGYDPGCYLTGSAVMSEDLFDTADQDFAMTTYISVIAIFLIVMVVFRSISIPAVLVACIELAIYANEGIPYWIGQEIPFIANTFIGCIQLGATVDYSILIATRFREEIQRGYDPREAMVKAATAADHSIITGGLVLFCSCVSVSLISNLSLVSSLCTMLARGTLISVIVCLFVVPPVLLVCEPIIRRTSQGWLAPIPAGKTLPVRWQRLRPREEMRNHLAREKFPRFLGKKRSGAPQETQPLPPPPPAEDLPEPAQVGAPSAPSQPNEKNDLSQPAEKER